MNLCQFYFFDDQKIGFEQTSWYLENTANFKKLLQRIEGSITGVSMDFVTQWHSDASFFYNRIKDDRNYLSFHRFLSTYDAIDYLIEIYSFDSKVGKL